MAVQRHVGIGPSPSLQVGYQTAKTSLSQLEWHSGTGHRDEAGRRSPLDHVNIVLMEVL